MIARPVLDPDDVRTPSGSIEPPPTRMISEFIAAEHQELVPDRQAVRLSETEPHGMYWFRPASNAAPQLRAHAWFYAQVAATADQMLAHACGQYGKDKALQAQIAEMATCLRDYIEHRTAINEMAGPRKLNQELGDAAYQLCQSAKYCIDAYEKTQYRLARGEPIDNNEQIGRLEEMSERSLVEGYVVAQAVIRASDQPLALDFDGAARRVVDYSCRKLTEWFANNRQNQENAQRAEQVGAAINLSQFFKHIAPRRA